MIHGHCRKLILDMKNGFLNLNIFSKFVSGYLDID